MNVASYTFYRHPASAYESERAGAARGRFFVNYVRAVVRGHWSCFADWELRVHHDERVREFPYWSAMREMQARGLLRLVPMGEARTLCGSMLWRMRPAWESGVEYLICRDLDSFPTPRERKAVDAWTASGRAIHGMQDSMSHSSTVLMGGMVGFLTDFVREEYPTWEGWIEKVESLGIDLNRLGADQLVLAALYGGFERQTLLDTKATLGPRDDPRDQLTNHIGGAYHVDPVVNWFAKHREFCSRLAEIEECEREVAR